MFAYFNNDWEGFAVASAGASGASSACERHLAVLRAGRIGWLELATLVGRLPIGINGLALVLFLREETGSFARRRARSRAGWRSGSGSARRSWGASSTGAARACCMLARDRRTPPGSSRLLALGRDDAPTRVLVARRGR